MSHTITIPNYRPPRTNDLFRKKFRQRLKLEEECKAFVGVYGAGVPKAQGKRRVFMRVVLARRQREPDSEELCLKAVLDALVWHKLLIDDRRQWCEVVPTEYELTDREQPETTITLEDCDGRPV